jgi:reactive intermediate/imine deaminase
MDVQRLNPEGLPKPLGGYCQVTRRGPIVTTAGMIATNAEGKVVGEGDVQAQTRQVLRNVQAALEAAGASLEDVVKTTVFLKDLAHFKDVQPVYNEFFGAHPPARATVGAALVLPSLLIEVDAMAVLDEGQ